MTRQTLSVTIITRDEEQRLQSCLDSVQFADEILVVDSGSSDGTVALAEKNGCRVIAQDWLGYGPQKQFAVEQAANDWVLCLDADERVSVELATEIKSEMEAPRLDAYEMPRCNRFLGRWLRHGEGYPDLSLRLFDRRHARWSDDAVHEKVVSNKAPGRLRGDLMHESQETLDSYLEKQNRYTTLQARQLANRGKKIGVAKMWVSPLFRFVKMYLLRRGFLDGMPGLVHIAIGCFNSFIKYAKAREMQKAGRVG